jgi:hypothetical protein
MRVVVLSVSVLLFLSGCFLAPFIESFKSAGATQSDREALLPKDLKRFTEALSWGSPEPVLALVDDSARKDIQEQLNEKSETERVVESKVTGVTYEDDSYKASVAVKVKYYRIPYYVVQERKEQLEWKFSLGTGWRLTSRVVG